MEAKDGELENGGNLRMKRSLLTMTSAAMAMDDFSSS